MLKLSLSISEPDRNHHQGFSAKIQPQTLELFKQKADVSDSVIASIG